MKKIFVLIIIAFLISGCNKKKESPIYSIDKNSLYQSSANAYDYSYSLNKYWKIIYSDDNNKIYENDKNNVKIGFVKNSYNNSIIGTNISASEIPKLFKNYSINNIELNSFKENDSQIDYHDQFKFYHSTGTVKDNKYQAIFFLTDHFIPSVYGEKIANCIFVIYTDESENTISKFINRIEQSICYE